jgi:uroporphyrinogen decarboxylase
MSFDYLNALAKKPVSRTPIWVMRQAGRYLPEYRATRKKAGSFMDLCKNKELACEVTMQPLDRFDLDAAILFSDILTIPDGMGLELYFEEGEGPKFKKPIQSLKDIENLPTNVNDDLTYVFDAVSTIKTSLNNRVNQVPLIGFSGSPWTLATYMIEGGSSKNFHQSKKMLFNEPESMHLLLRKLADSVVNYLNQQVLSGADSLMIFDTWGGVLSRDNYLEFSLKYMQKIVKELKTFYTQIRQLLYLVKTVANIWSILQLVAVMESALIGLWSLGEVEEQIGDKVCIQGNLDPAILAASPEVIEREVAKVMKQFKGGTGHIFNLGHGITPEIEPEKMQVLVEAVHNFKR